MHAGTPTYRLGALALAAALLPVAAPAALTSWRLLATTQATYDLTFASVARPAGSNAPPLLAVNDAQARTHFVSPGGSIAGRKILTYDPQAEMLTIADADGRHVLLPLGTPLPVGGLEARLAYLPQRTLYSVHAGDSIPLNRGPMVITAITTNGVTATVSGKESTIVPANEAEWRSLQPDPMAQPLEPVATKVNDDWTKKVVLPPANRAPNIHWGDASPSFTYATDYPYPVAYTVIPPVWQDGKIIRPAAVIPTRFEYRRHGYSSGSAWSTPSCGVPPPSVISFPPPGSYTAPQTGPRRAGNSISGSVSSGRSTRSLTTTRHSSNFSSTTIGQ